MRIHQREKANYVLRVCADLKIPAITSLKTCFKGQIFYQPKLKNGKCTYRRTGNSTHTASEESANRSVGRKDGKIKAVVVIVSALAVVVIATSQVILLTSRWFCMTRY